MPFENEYANPGRDDMFTCPGCMADIKTDNPSKMTECPKCGVHIECRVDQQPVAVCSLVEWEEDEDDG